MDERLKQRLVGAIVLVALAVIFIPMILNGNHEKTLPPFGQAMPEKPRALKKLEAEKAPNVPVPAAPAMTERQLVDKNTPPLKAQSGTVAKTAPKPVPEIEPKAKIATVAKPQAAQKTVKAWVVQVGSFSSRKNAVALSNKLRKYKYAAFVEAVKTNGNWTYRVRVGPEVRRSSAESIQKTLRSRFKINGVVMGHP